MRRRKDRIAKNWQAKKKKYNQQKISQTRYLTAKLARRRRLMSMLLSTNSIILTSMQLFNWLLFARAAKNVNARRRETLALLNISSFLFLLNLSSHYVPVPTGKAKEKKKTNKKNSNHQMLHISIPRTEDRWNEGRISQPHANLDWLHGRGGGRRGERVTRWDRFIHLDRVSLL